VEGPVANASSEAGRDALDREIRLDVREAKMTRIDDYPQTNRIGSSDPRSSSDDGAGEQGTKFGQFMDDVADASLKTASAVAPALPGGELVKMAADGLRELKGDTPGALSGSQSEKFDQMWEMQRQNQVYNMQYMQLQQAAQAQNRQFKTLSNLMKVRHDTAKSAINNMRA